MALNLKTLGIRSLSAAVFVILLLGSVLWNYYSFTSFFFIVSLIGLNEFFKISEKLGAKPFKVVGFICAILLYLAFMNFYFLIYDAEIKNYLIYCIALIPFVLFTSALFSKKENPLLNFMYTFAGIIYAVLPFALLNQLVLIKETDSHIYNYYPSLVLGTIFLIWSNDTFAYLGGSLFGKHKMIERISPGKTWEGTVFGILVTFGVSFLIKTYLLKTEDNIWLTLGMIVPILATIGDLIESMLKRQAGIKDSGTIMPGHGGILDRFDSLIFVSPFVYVIFKLL
ncbi:MAG: phosphatidate cytidylyltransferase [Bacteroidota bacterium]|nr:phosphatidate cytidylyltransferase [Bacteroidota bacterium]